MNKVDTILSLMIKAWPTLYRSRWTALRDICSFSEYDGRWDENGDLVILEKSKISSDRDFTNRYHEDDIVKAQERLETARLNNRSVGYAEGEFAAAVIRRDWDIVKQQFTVDHADLVAQSRRGEFPNSMNYNEFRFLETLPENIDPEWLAAFVEYAEELLHRKFDEHPYRDHAPDYKERYRREWKEAQDRARAFLIRVRGSDTEKKALSVENFQKQLAALVEKAAKEGIRIDATVS